VDVLDGETLASRRQARDLAPVDAAHRNAARHHVAFGDHAFDLVMGIHGGARPSDDVPEAFDAAPVLGNGCVVDDVRRHELVEQIQVVPVVDLLDQTPDNGLVLFFRH